jgi:hypothetical protein
MNPIHYFKYLILGLFISLSSCSNSDDPQIADNENRNQSGEYIYRVHNEHLFDIPSPEVNPQEPYPWEKGTVGNHPKITKEFFRCKGSNLNPVHIVQEKEELIRYFDCGGAEKHSLPLRDGKEFIHPILIDLVNYIQAKSKKRVVITSGHRCPEHNSYVDAGKNNLYSKHMIGAEVSFYVQGLEEQPEAVIRCIQEYYKATPKYQDKKDFLEFHRYDKKDVDVSTPPWCNKEIFVKLYKKKEGRNFDNRHPYPYISIQVRYDYDTAEKVIYTWDKANHNYLRH